MAYYDDDITTALELIEEFGEPVKWRIIEDGTPADPTQPWNPGQSSTEDKDVFICFLQVDKDTKETFTFIKGTEVPKSSLLGYMGNVPFKPNLKDVVIRNEKELRIAYIDLLSPNGQEILYTVLFQE